MAAIRREYAVHRRINPLTAEDIFIAVRIKALGLNLKERFVKILSIVRDNPIDLVLLAVITKPAHDLLQRLAVGEVLHFDFGEDSDLRRQRASASAKALGRDGL